MYVHFAIFTNSYFRIKGILYVNILYFGTILNNVDYLFYEYYNNKKKQYFIQLIIIIKKKELKVFDILIRRDK